MKKWKKGIALLTVCILMISMAAGCGATGQKENETDDPAGTAKGRFVESEVDLPEKIQTVCAVGRSENGEITLLGYGDETFYLAHGSGQGDDWSQKKIKSFEGGYANAVNGEDGSAVAFGYNKADGITFISADGSVKKVKLDLPTFQNDQDSENFITSAVYANNRLFVTDLNRAVYEVDPATGAMTAFATTLTEPIDHLLADGDRFALGGDSGIWFADAKSGELVENDTVLQKAIEKENHMSENTGEIAMAMGASDEELYYITHEGLFYHKFGGSTIEQLMDGDLTSVCDKNMGFHALFRQDDKNFLLFARDAQGKERCFRYSYDATVSTIPENQLTVYALEDSNALQQLITVYQKKYPEVMVKKEIGMSGDDGITAEDAIKTLNTEVLAGNGPDVFVLDGLPIDSYIEKGALADLYSYVNEAEKTEGLFTNVTDACEMDGAVYQVPARFYFSIAEGSNDFVANSNDLKSLKQYVGQLDPKKEPVYGPWPAEMVLYTLYCVDSASWKGTSGLDTARLEQFLDTAKTLYDADGYEETQRAGEDGDRGIWEGQLISVSTQTMMSRLCEMGQVSMGTMTDISSMQQLFAAIESKGGTYALLDAKEHNVFVPYVSLGLSASAAENTYAQEWIRLALSEEGQTQITDGFSINRMAFAAQCEDSSDFMIGTSYKNGGAVDLDIKKMTKKQQEILTGLLERLDTPSWNDRVVEDLVLSQGEQYLQGRQSLEETVSAITKKVQLYEAQ